MIASNRIALSLTVAVHILLLYALGKLGGHPIPVPAGGEPCAVNFIPMLPTQLAKIIAPTPPRPEQALLAASPHPATAPMSAAIAIETKVSETPAPVVAGAGLLAQSALNAIGKMDHEERRSSPGGSNLTSNSLGVRLSESINKNSAVPAGSIDENVYPDGRREERIHGPFGVDYCITYESPSNPTDGFDTMQRGLKPSVPHTCGHRFD